MKRSILLILCMVLLLSGCIPAGNVGTDSGARVVTGVQISLVPDNGSEPYRTYTDEEKVEWVLSYIDSIHGEENPRRAPQDEIGCWEITCVYMNGEEKAYYLREDRYFREEGGPWVRIEESNTGFTQYLLDNPSDQNQDSALHNTTEETSGGFIKVPTVRDEITPNDTPKPNDVPKPNDAPKPSDKT